MRATMYSTEDIACELSRLRDNILDLFECENQRKVAEKLFSNSEEVIGSAIEAVESEVRQAEYDADYARSNRDDVIEEHENLKERIRTTLTGPHPADPDPYDHHGLEPELRRAYIEHYMRTGEYRP